MVWVCYSLAYVLTRRIAVPIIIHMLQNGFVVTVQFFFGDTVKHLQEQSNFIIHFILINMNLLISSFQMTIIDAFLFSFNFPINKPTCNTYENHNYRCN